MDKDELIRYLDRKLKIRTIYRFEREQSSPRDLEREFALAALDLVKRQPAMAALAGVGTLDVVEIERIEAALRTAPARLQSAVC
jgi:hypothetical protein